MRTAIVYVYPNLSHNIYDPRALRFSKQFVRFPPGMSDHELYVCVNGGGEITKRQESLFDPLAPVFIYHNNAGRDIGAFIMAARNVPCDLLFCIGAPARPRAAGWLDAFVRAVEENGPGIYGQWGFHAPDIHIRTTVFAITPQLLNAYPIEIDDSRRYHFEHSHDSITRFCMKKGFAVKQVTVSGVCNWDKFHHVECENSWFNDQHGDRHGVVDQGDGW